MKVIKHHFTGGICIGHDDINHLNESTNLSTKFVVTTPQKSNIALIDAIFNNITAHHGLFPMWGMDLLHGNMKNRIQLYMMTTASVLNAAMATNVSTDINN